MWSWRTGKSLFERLFTKIPEDQRGTVIKKIFSTGRAIGWLMREIIDSELYAHGLVGDKEKCEEERLFTKEELEAAIALMIDRLKTKDRDKIIETPSVLGVLYAWSHAGDNEGAVEWVNEQLETDQYFLRLLSACRSWMQSDRTYYPLNRRDLTNFLDFDVAEARLENISNDTKKAIDERNLASELLAAIRLGD